MLLARMLATDEDALICDMAETYHIFDFRALPVKLLATLISGFRPDSRIMMALSDASVTQTETLLAGILDGVRHIAWMLSADGQKGRNHPEQILDILMSKEKGEDITGAVKAFNSSTDFEAALKAAKGGG